MRPILFHIGSYPVYAYGTMLFLAFLAGVWVAGRELRRRGQDHSLVYPVGAVAAVCGVAGARLFYVLGHLGEFRGDWGAVFDLNMRGLVFYGGLFLAVPCCYLLVRRLGVPGGEVADSAGLGLPLGLAIARVGCFLNGCCGGKPSGLPWAVTFPGSGTAVHPAQLYEMVLDLALFGALLFARRKVRRGWSLFLLAVGGYGVIRFFLEFFRDHPRASAGIFFQVTSSVLAVLAFFLVWYRERPGVSHLEGTGPHSAEGV